MRMQRLRWVSLSLLAVMLASCAGNNNANTASGQMMDYKEVKTMVIDILKTEDAQKAFSEAQKKLDTNQVKLLSTGDGLQIQTAVKEVLTKTDQVALIQQLMVDPSFAGEFAKASQVQIKQMHKELIKDPDYQKSMIEVMKNPDYQKIIADTMKATEYRQQVMTIVQEALQSPLYKTELINLMKKALQENAVSMKKAGTQGGQGQQGQGQEGQGQEGQGQEGESQGQEQEQGKNQKQEEQQ